MISSGKLARRRQALWLGGMLASGYGAVFIIGIPGITAWLEDWLREKKATDDWQAIHDLGTTVVVLGFLCTVVFAGLVVGYLAQKRRRVADCVACSFQVPFLDPVTNLPGRLLGRDRLEHAIAQARRTQRQVALLLIDIDRFRLINNSHGHDVGNIVLLYIANRLSKCLRHCDNVSRHDGAQFMIVLEDVRDTAAIGGIIGKLSECCLEPIEVKGQEANVCLSIGGALFPDDGDSYDVLLQKADTALDSAKKSGGNTHRFFSEAMHAESRKWLEITSELRHAIRHDEFVLFFQPQVRIETGQIVGAEALIRWNHPRKGLLNPAEFIEVAEGSGLIAPIGEWVLHEACAQVKRWEIETGQALSIAVNVSAVQFRQGNLKKTVLSALEKTGLLPAQLELEMTESVLIHDVEGVRETLTEIGSVGVKVSIDDFGTGYSSLSYLSALPVDKIKIDQSFVRGLDQESSNVAIVRAIVQLAEGMGKSTVAEGVEDKWALDLLSELGCDLAQGYYLGRPMPADHFVETLQQAIISNAPRSVPATGLFCEERFGI